MTQHTAGPWTISQRKLSSGGFVIRAQDSLVGHILREEDARLIAEVPELLDILQAIVNDEDIRIASGRRIAALHNNLDGVGQTFDYMDDPIEPEWLAVAKAAIAKAAIE